ncbi:MAG: hypothetical protein HYT41_01160 [Candidatus Sungbacteria bacterium]|nr:hypothetical protein [Candidatus Sungbacteria bacterium]
MLSDAQLKLIAETLSNIGLVFFGSMVVPIFTGIAIPLAVLFAGIFLSIISWMSALVITKHTPL